MDKYRSANSIAKIELGQQSKFFGGRSIAIEVLENYSAVNWSIGTTEIDFTGVESCTQSFISELLYRLKEKGARRGFVKYITSNERIETRMNTELKRFGLI